MKKEDLTIDIIHHKTDEFEYYVATMKHPDFAGIIVQCDTFEEIEVQLAKTWEVIIKYQIRTKNYIITEFK